MKRLLLGILLLTPLILNAQSDRKLIRQGYRSYMDSAYNEAEVDFRKAEDINKESFEAKYNTSTALYQQEKIEESAQRFEELLAESENNEQEAKLYHNLGNSFLETNKLQESIEAYKKSLRLNPTDEDTRYNLAYALEKLQQQQKQQQENKDDKNQDKKDQQENNQDQEKQDQEKQDQDKKDQQDDNQEQAKEGDQQQSQPNPQQLSKEDAERLLNAILQKEKDVKEKVDEKKAAATKVKTDKDW